MQLSFGDADILAEVRASFQGAPPKKMAVAVSGGGDSVALLHLLSRCFDPGEVELVAATVDHGLRAEAAEEAAGVGVLARRLGIPHTVLAWRDHDDSGNLQDNARRARFRLLAEWALAQDIRMVLLGHTADDQAETVLMRLARAAGTDGLAAIRRNRTQHGVTFLRPMLGLTRAELRAYLTSNAVTWVEDPSNSDQSFDRVKARQLLPVLEPLGISARALAEVADNMGRARDALNWYAFLAARDMAEVVGGSVALDARRFRTLPEEIARRLMIHAIRWIAGAEYPPRRAPVAAMVAAARAGKASTLAGCRLVGHSGRVWLCREHEAVQGLRVPAEMLWDARWRLVSTVAAPEGAEIAALGADGLQRCPDRRLGGLPRAALLSSPALWVGPELVAAPLAGLGNGWSAELDGGSEAFYAAILSH